MAEDINEPGAGTPQAPLKTEAATDTVLPVGGEAMPGSTADAAGDGAQGTGFKGQAQNFARQAADKARDLGAEGKERAADALGEVSRMMGNAADTVDEKLGAQYGKYARSAAEGLGSFSESLKAKEIDDLLADAQNFVRKSPAVAIGVAAALGFVIARLVKSGGAADRGSDNA